ncbi:MAG: hypothetical protein EB078_07215 [Proteobacteria bacterium]|nr:hypothetical protein [Pseudomonadota bacterium]NDC24788.1 hypothetical protein [Pseudomonadota bacterium]NDD04679.1 hypothetical protein [Pseudomonadota bacterium]
MTLGCSSLLREIHVLFLVNVILSRETVKRLDIDAVWQFAKIKQLGLCFVLGQEGVRVQAFFPVNVLG